MRQCSRILLVITIISIGLVISACSQAASSTQQSVVQIVETVTTPPPTPSPSKTATDIPTSTSTEIPPTNTPPPTDTSSPTPACTNKAEFVKHLTIGDNTALKPEEYFAKIWLVKNVGTCTWTQEYSLVFDSGTDMQNPPSVTLPKVVAPGETVELRVDLFAPIEKDTYTSNWMLEDGSGNKFGVGESGGQPIEVTIVIRATPWPTSS
jgi:hypothetical protein